MSSKASSGFELYLLLIMPAICLLLLPSSNNCNTKAPVSLKDIGFLYSGESCFRSISQFVPAAWRKIKRLSIFSILPYILRLMSKAHFYSAEGHKSPSVNYTHNALFCKGFWPYFLNMYHNCYNLYLRRFSKSVCNCLNLLKL